MKTLSRIVRRVKHRFLYFWLRGYNNLLSPEMLECIFYFATAGVILLILGLSIDMNHPLCYSGISFLFCVFYFSLSLYPFRLSYPLPLSLLMFVALLFLIFCVSFHLINLVSFLFVEIMK